MLSNAIWFVHHCLAFIVFKLVCCFFKAVHYSWLHLSGKMRLQKSYETCANVQRILWTKKIFSQATASSSEFLLLHKEFVHPKLVLQPEFSLYSVCEKEALFIKAPSWLNVYSSDTNPFCYIAQARHGIVLVSIPLWAFHKLASDLGDPTSKVIWVSSTGRCGATIFCQVLERIPRSCLICEPDGPTKFCALRCLGKISMEEFNKGMTSIVRLQCKPIPNVDTIYIKSKPQATMMVDGLAEHFPSIQQVFVYRNSLKQLSSLTKVFPLGLRYIVDSKILSRLIPNITVRFYKQGHIYKMDSNKEIPTNLDTSAIFTHWWANQVAIVKEAIGKGIDILAVRFEDIIPDANRLEEFTRIFTCLGLDVKYVGVGLEAFSKDSQRDTPVSWDSVDYHRGILSDAEKKKADVILESYGLSPLGVNIELKKT